jgi:hypothetical protein
VDFVEVIVEAMLQRRLAFIHELPRRGLLGNPVAASKGFSETQRN